MKLVLAAILLMTAAPSFANQIFSTRVFSTESQSLDLPQDLNFTAEKISVLSPTWYSSLFEETGCEPVLSAGTVNTAIEITADGARSMALRLNGHRSAQFNQARASYVPIYYKFGQPVHPHFMVKTKGWVMLHVSIHRGGSKKHLKISVVQGGKDGKPVTLVPVLEADGH